MRKLKPMMPSLREKKRYVAYEIISSEKIRYIHPVAKEIKAKSLSFLGELRTARMGLLFPVFNEATQRGLIKVNHKEVESLRAIFPQVCEIEKIPCVLHTVGVSGILKKAQLKYVNKCIL